LNRPHKTTTFPISPSPTHYLFSFASHHNPDKMATEIPPSADPAPATTTSTEEEATPERLNALITSANLQYSLKNYDAAAETYSQATELQATLNGEMAPDNAELLYLYGRCLFKVAVIRSDVLGGQVAGEAPKPKKKSNGDALNGTSASIKEETKNAPFFHVLESDPEDDDDEDEEGEGDGEAQEEEDDFATAYEILDLARVLYAKQMEDVESANAVESSDKGKGKATESEPQSISPDLRHIKERLADTHDLQAEISLENERFEDAVEDSRSTLKLRQQIDPIESELIAEAHYKLALALEFTFFKAVREAKEQQGQNGSASSEEVQPKMLYEAVENLVAAILSCEARIAKEESKLPNISAEEASKKKKDIQEVREIVQEMMTRVSFLQL
jgi:HAT1-interacting factor 1